MPHPQTGQKGSAGLLQCSGIILTCFRARMSARQSAGPLGVDVNALICSYALVESVLRARDNFTSKSWPRKLCCKGKKSHLRPIIERLFIERPINTETVTWLIQQLVQAKSCEITTMRTTFPTFRCLGSYGMAITSLLSSIFSHNQTSLNKRIFILQFHFFPKHKHDRYRFRLNDAIAATVPIKRN